MYNITSLTQILTAASAWCQADAQPWPIAVVLLKEACSFLGLKRLHSCAKPGWPKQSRLRCFCRFLAKKNAQKKTSKGWVVFEVESFAITFMASFDVKTVSCFETHHQRSFQRRNLQFSLTEVKRGRFGIGGLEARI